MTAPSLQRALDQRQSQQTVKTETDGYVLKWVHRHLFDAWVKTPAWLQSDFVALRANLSGTFFLQKNPGGVKHYHPTREALEAAVRAYVEARGGALTIVGEDEHLLEEK